jgi:hypothetical protein
VVVCYDITVRRDDNARAGTLLLRSLNLTFLVLSLTALAEHSEWVEEIAEWVALNLNLLNL